MPLHGRILRQTPGGRRLRRRADPAMPGARPSRAASDSPAPLALPQEPDVPARPKLLACGSGGGHWIQLLRMRAGFDRHDVHYVSTFANYAEMVAPAPLYTVPDASRADPWKFVPVFARALWIMARVRPRAVVTTGSMPMLAFLILGRLTGARTLWIDSIANAERLSSSGRLARRLAHQVVSQWPDVAAREGVECWGAVL